ncbi:MAG: DUF1273 family protein [Oscillospiraceae bacterium]|nr:DUF1273 family protein [Oscillospiraceae bacterium]
MADFSEIRRRTACFTGHRELGEPPGELERRVDAAIRDLYARGVRYFGAGGARGFDALASERVLTLKEELPELALVLVLPFPEQYRQEGNWSREELAQFDALLLRADRVVTLEAGYSPGVYQRRNRYLADRSAFCICYLQRMRSGTGGTVRYAKSLGLEIIDLVPYGFRLP